jgi:CheY-like chemotaxis protein
MGRILVLEPDPDVRDLLVRLIRHLGHDAPRTDKGFVPDAVLVEPGDAHSAARARKLVDQHSGLPVVCASIYPRSIETTGLKPVAYLTKPISLPELRSALAAALGSG